MFEHRHGLTQGFANKYGLKKLVYCESFGRVYHAITREKQLKRWHRDWKINLIEELNSGWVDLHENWIDPETSSG